MNIEDLSKSQLLLLTILVNFVTAIATAVLAVSLLDEAPPIITQTVNRIVEHTIETIVPSTPQATTETVVINNEDFRTQAIAASVARTVTLSKGETPLATGIYLHAEHAVASYLLTPPKEVTVTFADGSKLEAKLAGTNGGVVVYRFIEGAVLPDAPGGVFVAQDTVKQGQTVISLSADGSAVVGIVSKIDAMGIQTSLPSMPLGSAAVNLDGDIIGIAGDAPGLYINEGRVAQILSSS